MHVFHFKCSRKIDKLNIRGAYPPNKSFASLHQNQFPSMSQLLRIKNCQSSSIDEIYVEPLHLSTMVLASVRTTISTEDEVKHDDFPPSPRCKSLPLSRIPIHFALVVASLHIERLAAIGCARIWNLNHWITFTLMRSSHRLASSEDGNILPLSTLSPSKTFCKPSKPKKFIILTFLFHTLPASLSNLSTARSTSVSLRM